MGSEKIKTEVLICGKVYTVVGEESQEYIQKLALLVEKKLSDIKSNKSSNALSKELIAILTAINIADDYYKLIEDNKQNNQQIEDVESKLNRCEVLIQDREQEIQKLTLQVKELEEQLLAHQEEISKLQQENLDYEELLDEYQLEVMELKQRIQ